VQDRTREKRSRRTFWLDDRIVDEFGPVMGQFPTGAAALAVYTVLARRADRDGDSWPRMRAIADQAGISPRTVQRAMRLLEALGLVEVASCHEQGSNRQTSNLYTLLTPPETAPAIDPDPVNWPAPPRRQLLVRAGNRAQSVADAREPEWWEVVQAAATPRHGDTPSAVKVAAPLRLPDTPSPVTVAGLEGNTNEGNPVKEMASDVRLATHQTFLIAEVGLSNRQVWAAVLEELGRRGELTAGELETWLRPAALIGREGETLIVGVPNAVSRDRIARRLLPALRRAMSATVGGPVDVAIVVAEAA
jgi:DNA-binding transcriptional ArsR family regulator